MKSHRLLKLIFFSTVIEAGLLTCILYLIPAEASGRLIFGRSIYRWILLLPAAVLFFTSTTLLVILSRRNAFDKLKEKIQTYIKSQEYFVEYLFVYAGFSAISLTLSLLILKLYNSSIFLRVLPWIIFVVCVLLQTFYLLYQFTAESSRINIKVSLGNIPTLVYHLLLEDRPHVEKRHSGAVWLQRLCMILLSVAFLLTGFYTIKYGQLNSDEGWYLYAARLIYHGQQPYKDFAFTQMPLVPYIYGLGLLIYSSIYTGRLISFFFFCLSLFLIFQTSKKYYTIEAFFWLFLIFLVYADGFYFSIIVKTYSLTLFFFISSSYIFLFDGKSSVKYPALFLLLTLGVFTRLTFVFYAVVIALYAIAEIWTLKNKFKIYFVSLITMLPLIAWGILFFFPKPEVTLWNIYGYHMEARGVEISSAAIPNFLSHLKAFLKYSKLFYSMSIPLLMSMFSSLTRGDWNTKRNFKLLISATAVFLFLCSHFTASSPYLEYYVPAVLYLTAIAVWFLFSRAETRSGLRIITLWAGRLALTIIIISLINEGKFGIDNYNYYKGHPPIETVRKMAEMTNRYFPAKKVFAMEGLYTSVEGRFDVWTELSMSTFSLFDISTEKAKELHVLTPELASDLLTSPQTKVLILTERDKAMLGNSIAAFNDILEQKYDMVYETDYFGQKSAKAYLYVRK